MLNNSMFQEHKGYIYIAHTSRCWVSASMSVPLHSTKLLGVYTVATPSSICRQGKPRDINKIAVKDYTTTMEQVIVIRMLIFTIWGVSTP